MTGFASMESILEAFESAWRDGPRPRIAAFWRTRHASADPTERRDLLVELIQVDLEYRWRLGKALGRRPAARGPKLEWYLKQVSELGSLDTLPQALVAQEYRVRRRWGDRPSHAEYVARFSRGGLALAERLAGVDVALAEEGLRIEGSPPFARLPTSRPADPDAPLSIADYVLKRQIGEGGMCKVYTAVQTCLDKPVAIKVLRKELLADEFAVQRFRREARLTASLKQRGIVDVHGLGRLPDGGYFMVLDLIVGQDLSRLGVVPPVRAARLMADLAEILGQVHQAGIIHCDLKPANVLVDDAENIYLNDFGLARRFGEAVPESIFDAHPAGTAAYMAPEQIDPHCGQVGPWTDVYGLGGVLYSMLFGRPPAEDLSRTLETAPLHSCDEQLRMICRRCLRPSPADRYRDVQELIDLAQFAKLSKMQG